MQTYGPSMLPTLSLTDSLVLAERISTRFGMVRPGDIVLLRSPNVPTKVVAKRLIGMEGDTVSYFVDPKNSDRCETIVVCLLFIFIFIFVAFIRIGYFQIFFFFHFLVFI